MSGEATEWSLLCSCGTSVTAANGSQLQDGRYVHIGCTGNVALIDNSDVPDAHFKVPEALVTAPAAAEPVDDTPFENAVEAQSAPVEPTKQKRGRGRPKKGEENPFRDDKFTPPSLLLPLMAEDHYTLDVCGHPLAPAAKIIPAFITKEQNSLQFSWRGHRVWANVPFSNIDPFLEKAWSETCFVRMLVPSWTDRTWWHKYVEPFRDRPGSRLTTRFLKREMFGDPTMPIREKGQADFWPVLLRFERTE